MPSAASSALAIGWAANLAHHGEPLGYVEADQVQRGETGQAVTNESGVATLIDDTAATIQGIFDEAHEVASRENIGMVTTSPAAIVNAADVEGIEPGAVIIRNGTHYYVMDAQHPAADGRRVLILSKQVH